MEQENQNVESFNQSNDGYTTAGVIQLRLDTAPMLDQLEAFFKGKRIGGYVEVQGAIKPQFVPVGTPKMNDEGVQSILSWLTPLFSPATVQGNFPDYDDLINYLVKLELDLQDYLWKNRYKWEIKKEDVDGIIDMILNVAEPFFSRLVNNEERKSYSTTMKHTEATSVERDSKRFGLF